MTALKPLFQPALPKPDIIQAVQNHLTENGFTIAEMATDRPWGGYFRIANEQADRFIATYFAGMDVPEHARHGERSPKILLVAPQQRLSWQYHDRRSEVWRTVQGQVGVYYSDTDQQPDDIKVLRTGEMITLAQGERHRLTGLEDWGAVAEIWLHTDPQNPSNEDDIYRLQDDYQRI